jgi:hypothetical protein
VLEQGGVSSFPITSLPQTCPQIVKRKHPSIMRKESTVLEVHTSSKFSLDLFISVAHGSGSIKSNTWFWLRVGRKDFQFVFYALLYYQHLFLFLSQITHNLNSNEAFKRQKNENIWLCYKLSREKKSAVWKRKEKVIGININSWILAYIFVFVYK